MSDTTRFTITVPDEINEWVKASDVADSKSGTVQHHLELARRLDEADATLDDLLAAHDRVDELESEVSRLEARVDELTNQLREANRRNDEVTELVEFVEEEKSLTQARRERASAPVWKRAKWWVTGYPEDE
jgi:predicted nuclease with TOPRIM domain